MPCHLDLRVGCVSCDRHPLRENVSARGFLPDERLSAQAAKKLAISGRSLKIVRHPGAERGVPRPFNIDISARISTQLFCDWRRAAPLRLN